MNQPKISILIPVYNREFLVAETLQSIADQTYTNWECVLVDDGSTDNTEKVVEGFIKKDSRFQYHKRPDTLPKGGNVCRNLAFSKSTGELIQWFDSDDLLLANALEEKVKLLKTEDDYCICAMDIFRGELDNIVGVYNDTPSDNIIGSFMKDELLLNIPSFLYRRSMVAGFTFSETLTRAQDLDFVFRVVTQPDVRGSWTPEVLLKVRLHDGSITNRFQRFKKEDLTSEIHVRKHILEYAERLPHAEKNVAVTKYLNVLKRLLKAKKYPWFRSEISQCPVISKSLKRKLIAVAGVYRYSGRGLDLYNRMIKKDLNKITS